MTKLTIAALMAAALTAPAFASECRPIPSTNAFQGDCGLIFENRDIGDTAREDTARRAAEASARLNSTEE